MAQDVRWENCEQAIRQVRSVVAARINANDQGVIEEIHILAGPGRSPKQIVRDVESVLVAQFNLTVDHKKISIAQVEEDEDAAPLQPEFKRPKLVGVTLRTVGSMAEARVELLVGDQTVEGVAQGPSSSHNKLRLFVDTTIKALAPLTLDKYVFVTEDVSINSLAKHHVAQVALSLVSSSGEESLVGCALVRSDDREAVVKATLDAINRKLKFLQNS